MSEKTYDPVLRQAMTEIVAVLKKHDVAGYVALGSKSHFEFRVHVDATWNLMRVENRPDGTHALRLKVKGKLDQKQRDMLDATAGFMLNLKDNLGMQFLNVDAFDRALRQSTIVEHNPPPISNDDRELEDLV